MAKGDLTRGERLQIMLSPEELEALDDFRFRQRMPSRAAAVRELFRLGLGGGDQAGRARHEIIELWRIRNRFVGTSHERRAAEVSKGLAQP